MRCLTIWQTSQDYVIVPQKRDVASEPGSAIMLPSAGPGLLLSVVCVKARMSPSRFGEPLFPFFAQSRAERIGNSGLD